MKRGIYLFLFIIFIVPLSAFSQDEAQIKKDLQESYMSFLREEGFSPTIDSDGDVRFKYEGDSYYFCLTTDKKFLKILYVVEDGNKDDFNKLLLSANNTMKEYAKIRIIVYKNDSNCFVNLRVDNYLVENDDYKKIFYKSIKLIQNSEKFFKDDFDKTK